MKNTSLSEKETEQFLEQLGLERKKVTQTQAAALKETVLATVPDYFKMFPAQQQQTELEKLQELIRNNNPLPANFLKLFTEKLAAVQSLAPLYDNLITKVNAINSGITHAQEPQHTYTPLHVKPKTTPF